MDIIDAPQEVVKPTGPIQPHAQPVAVLADLDPMLDDAAVRQALVNAENTGLDPTTITIEDMVKGQSSPPNGAPVQTPEAPKAEVPEKFLKPDGTADVEKIQASSRQLDEATKVKEAAVNKTVEDYLAEYREKEAKFKNLPNPQRLAAQMPPSAPPPDVPNMSQQELEAAIRREYDANPILTVANLVDAAIKARLEPFEAKDRDERVRRNIAELATKDSRVLREDVFAAIKQKLDSDPDLWKLKNPHKAAYLEVKEEMRLGEPTLAQAQPSRQSAPVLAGGTPPSAPSVSGTANQDVLANLDKIDLKNRSQEAMGDAAVRAFLARSNR